MEVIVLRGKGSQLRQLAAALRGLKGVHKGELALADTAPHGGHSHSHPHKHAQPRRESGARAGRAPLSRRG